MRVLVVDSTRRGLRRGGWSAGGTECGRRRAGDGLADAWAGARGYDVVLVDTQPALRAEALGNGDRCGGLRGVAEPAGADGHGGPDRDGPPGGAPDGCAPPGPAHAG